MATAAVLFGTLGPLSKLAYDLGVTPLGFAAWRAILGAIVIGLVVAVGLRRGRTWVGLRSLPPRARLALGIAVVAGVILNLSLFVALDLVTVALALLCFYSYPALVTIVVVARERTRPGRIQLSALAMALLGIVALVAGSLDPAAGLTIDPLGIGLAFLAAAAQTVFILVSRRGYADLPSDQAVLAILGGDALLFVLIAVASGSVAALTAPLETSGAWLYILAAGVLGAGIPTGLFIVGVRRIGGVRTSILAMIEPVTGTILAAIVLGETLGPIQAVGGVLVLAAGVLLQRAPTSADGPRGDLADVAAAAPEDALIETLPLA